MEKSIVGMIDHALLHPTLTHEELRAGCQMAVELAVASVCVKPYAVLLASECLQSSSVAVSTVVGFPHGGNASRVKQFEAQLACDQGAKEIDMVINVAKALERDWGYVEREIRDVVDVVHRYAGIVKVIFATDYLTSDETKIKLCEVTGSAGAEFVKTSTGFDFVKQADGQLKCVGATEHDVRLMREHTPEGVGVKASGGIRSFEDALRMVQLGATRLGTSATRAIAAGEKDAIDGDY